MKREHIKKYEDLWRTFPLVFWRKCCSCGKDFRCEWGWRAITAPYMNGVGCTRYLCIKCAPTREDADDFFLNLRFIDERPPPSPKPPRKD